MARRRGRSRAVLSRMLPLRMFPPSVGARAEGVPAAHAAQRPAGGAPLDREVVRLGVRDRVSDVRGVPPERMRPETRFVADLRA